MEWIKILNEIETNAPTDAVKLSSTKKKKAKSSKSMVDGNKETAETGKTKTFKSKPTINIFRG